MNGIRILSLMGKELNSKIGKKGPEEDITQYSFKLDGVSVEIIEPTIYPEKINPLVFSLGISDFVLFRPDLDSKDLGETLASLVISGLPGAIVGDAGLVEQYTNGTPMSKWRSVEEDPIKIREIISQVKNNWSDEKVKVLVDQIFNLKSVGVVVLGTILKGTINVHDRLTLFPGDYKVEVKSLQLDDDNVQRISNGSRLGANIKGIKADDINRGSILGTQMNSGKTFSAEISCPGFIRAGIKREKKTFAYIGLQHSEASVSEDILPGQKKTVSITCLKEFAYEAGDPVYIVDPGARPRVLAKGKVL